MRPLEDICILIKSPDPEPPRDGQPYTPAREFYQYDRLAEELRRYTPARVRVVEGWPQDAAPRAMLLIAYHPAMREPLLAAAESLPPDEPRPLLLNLRYDDLSSLAEVARPAGIVVNERYARWRLRQEERIFRQIYGLKSLAPRLAPLLEPATLADSEHYDTYESRDPQTLPFILAHYIDAYWQTLSLSGTSPPERATPGTDVS